MKVSWQSALTTISAAFWAPAGVGYWIRKVIFTGVGLITAVVVVMSTMAVFSGQFPYGYNRPEELKKFQMEYRKEQSLVLEMFKEVFTYLSPELKESVANEYLDMTNTVLACKYMRLTYIRRYENCLSILFRVLKNQNGLIFFDWAEFMSADEEQHLGPKLMETMHDVYGAHDLIKAASIQPLLYNAGLGDPASFSVEENVIEFFRLWAVHVEKQGFAVYQCDAGHSTHYKFILIPRDFVKQWEVKLKLVTGGDQVESFLHPRTLTQDAKDKNQ
jgi:hypothetical protein